MKFLLDVCIASRTLRRTLAEAGYDVLSASAGYAEATDEDLLDMAYKQDRALVTRDKDFGKLIFARRLPHPCVIRLAGLSVSEEAEAIVDLIENESAAVRDRAIIVVMGDRVRIRVAKSIEYNDD